MNVRQKFDALEIGSVFRFSYKNDKNWYIAIKIEKNLIFVVKHKDKSNKPEFINTTHYYYSSEYSIKNLTP